MTLQLCQWTGTGTKGDPFRPAGSDGVAGWSVWDIRPDSTQQAGLCLVDCPTTLPGALRALGDLPDDQLSAAARNFLNNQLGSNFSDTRLGDFLSKMALQPVAGKWLPIRPPSGPGSYELWIGRLWFSAPKVAGGSPEASLARELWFKGGWASELPNIDPDAVLDWFELIKWKGDWVLVPRISGGGSRATDNFNRADADPIGGNWTTIDNAMKIVSNAVKPSNNANNSGAFWNAITWPNDQYSQVSATGSTGPQDTGTGPGTRATSASGGSVYQAYFNNNVAGEVDLYKQVNGAQTNLISRRPITWVSGQIGYLSSIGSTHQLKYNGANVGAAASDSAIASGSAAIVYSSTNAASGLDDWEGGDFGATREQEGYRWRSDDGSESTASWLASQDIDISRPASLNTRLRVLTNVTGDAPSEGLKLQYRRADSNDEWKDVN